MLSFKPNVTDNGSKEQISCSVNPAVSINKLCFDSFKKQCILHNPFTSILKRWLSISLFSRYFFRSPRCDSLSGSRTYLIWSNHPAMQQQWLLSKGKTSRTWQFSSQYAEPLQAWPSSAVRQRPESRMVPIYQLCRWRNAYHKSRRKSLWNPASNLVTNPDWHASSSL